MGSDGSPQPGNPPCPHCGIVRWRVWTTRLKPDRSDRFRKCKMCGHLTRTSQRVKHPPPR
jgi:hypothetical protein